MNVARLNSTFKTVSYVPVAGSRYHTNFLAIPMSLFSHILTIANYYEEILKEMLDISICLL